MSYENLMRKAENLKGLSRFELEKIKESAKRGEGPLAGLSRFEIECVMKLCENNRKSGGG